MPAKKKIYGKIKAAGGGFAYQEVEVDAIDANRTVKAHPEEWSGSPWPKDAKADADAAAAKAKAEADAKAKADADAKSGKG